MNVADDMAMGPVLPTPQVACSTGSSGGKDSTQETDQPQQSVLHRLAKIRRRQGVSIRSAARRMGVTMEQVRREERPDSNLSLDDLRRWQRALEVPLSELLVDDDAPIASPVLTRAKWLRLMKTVKALIELDASESATRMAQMLERQVLEVMPELGEVGAWHSVGQRRTQDELGRIAEDSVPVNFAQDAMQ